MIQLDRIDEGKPFDWGRTSQDYAKFRDIYPGEFFRRIVDLGHCTEGQRVLDLGTGTGVLPRAMARYGAAFTGADISANQIAEANRLSGEAGLAIDYLVAPAEEVPLPDGSFDVVTACQCFMYFDTEVIFEKIHRLLKPGGHFLILFMAWLPDESEIAYRSEQLVLRHNPVWNGARFSRFIPQPAPESVDLFTAKPAICYDLPVRFTRETWHGRIKACRGIGASSLPEETIRAWEEEHLAYMQTLPESFEIIHYCTIMDLQRRD